MWKDCRPRRWRAGWIAPRRRCGRTLPMRARSSGATWSRGNVDMKHPDEATLALFAGEDLGVVAQWRTRRHLAGCAQCRGVVAEFAHLRREVTDLNDLPDISWNRLAAEMKANIRVGLAAGECIRDTRQPLAEGFSGMRAALACASVAALLLAGLLLERPAPLTIGERAAVVSLQPVEHGIEVRHGDQAFVL